MKKIFNWTIGSTFRTIGRIIAYVLVGSLFAFLLHKSGISIYDLLGITKISALEISRTNIDYINMKKCDSCHEDDINTSNAYLINTGQMHFSTKFHGFYNNTSDTKLYMNLLVICANNTPIRAGQSIFNTTYEDIGQTMTYGAQCRLDNNNTGTLYYLPLGRYNIAGNSYCESPCNHFADWSYRITENSLIKYDSYLIYDETEYEFFRQNVKTISSLDKASQEIIDANNSNTNSIINNQNENTETIINNQNENSQNEIASQLACINITKENVKEDSKYLNSDGEIISALGWIITDYINVENATIEKIGRSGTSPSICYYNEDKTLISCTPNPSIEPGIIIPPNNTFYIRVSIEKSGNKPKYKICRNGNQAINDSLNNLNDSLNDDNISNNDVQNSLNFSTTDNSYGPFATFLTLPLQWVQDILASNQTCRPLTLPLPYVNRNLVLPCMTEFWNNMGAVGTLVQLCWVAVVGVRIFNGLFKLVVDTTSSQDNAEELTKIRSWEL